MMYVNQIIVLYTLHLHSAGCQLHLNKTGRRKTEMLKRIRNCSHPCWFLIKMSTCAGFLSYHPVRKVADSLEKVINRMWHLKCDLPIITDAEDSGSWSNTWSSQVHRSPCFCLLSIIVGQGGDHTVLQDPSPLSSVSLWKHLMMGPLTVTP